MSRSDRGVLSVARQVENLAELIPALRDHIARELRVADGYPSESVGSVEPATIDRRTASLSGKCSGAVETVDGFVVSCGRRRPCAEHDHPVSLTSTERAAEQRLRLQLELEDIEARLRTLKMIADSTVADARRLMGDRAPKADRCTGGYGREGNVEWGDSTCTRVPERDGGLCSACWQRERRWREKVGLTARERPVA